MDLWQLDATDLARLIRTGRASAKEAVESVLSRLHKVNPQINAVVRVLEQALADAETADAARARGHALAAARRAGDDKINIDQAGLPTDNGVMPLKDFIATEDSPVVANLQHAGAIMIGRTNAPAFSMRGLTDNALHGRTLQPVGPAVTCGGSSGGAGSAMAAGIGAIAQATTSAARCASPPTATAWSACAPARPRPLLQPSGTATPADRRQLMAVQGPLTRTVRDARLALEVMARGDPRDWRWNDVPLRGPPLARPIRVASCPRCRAGRAPGASRGRARRRQAPAAAGYAVEEVLPPDIERGIESGTRSCVTDEFGRLWPDVEKMGDPDTNASMRHGSTPQAGRSRPTSPP